MLEGLDAIDWSAVRHAYGAATDVPELLRQLASTDESVRNEAYSEAFGNIFHQGTRYSATLKAIPFLIEIATHSAPEVQEGALLLLSYCVAGYFSVCDGPQNGTGTIWGEAPLAMAAYGESRALLEEIERAAVPVVPLCLSLVEHVDPLCRSVALRVLAGFAAQADVLRPVLVVALERERAPEVRAMFAFALTHLLDVSQQERLCAMALDDPSELARVVATQGCLRRGIARAEHLERLFHWLEDEELAAQYGELSCIADDLTDDLCALLCALEPEQLTPALPALCSRLAHAADHGVANVLAAALHASFGKDHAPIEAAQLTEAQRGLLATLVDNAGIWRIGDVDEVLRSHRLPAQRAALASFLGHTI